MSKKNKKQQSNGFLLFMRDMQQDMRERGRQVALRDMTVLAGPKWAKLPDREKAAYNTRAKAERRGAGADPRGTGLMYVLPMTGRMDCTGELLSVSPHGAEDGGRECCVLKSEVEYIGGGDCFLVCASDRLKWVGVSLADRREKGDRSSVYIALISVMPFSAKKRPCDLPNHRY